MKTVEELRHAAAQLDAETIEFLLRCGADIMNDSTHVSINENYGSPFAQKEIRNDDIDKDIAREIQMILQSKS